MAGEANATVIFRVVLIFRLQMIHDSRNVRCSIVWYAFKEMFDVCDVVLEGRVCLSITYSSWLCLFYFLEICGFQECNSANNMQVLYIKFKMGT